MSRRKKAEGPDRIAEGIKAWMADEVTYRAEGMVSAAWIVFRAGSPEMAKRILEARSQRCRSARRSSSQLELEQEMKGHKDGSKAQVEMGVGDRRRGRADGGPTGVEAARRKRRLFDQ